MPLPILDLPQPTMQEAAPAMSAIQGWGNISQTRADTQMKQITAQLAPIMQKINALRAITGQEQIPISKGRLISRAESSPAGMSLIALDPVFANRMAQAMRNTAEQFAQQNQNPLTQGLISQIGQAVGLSPQQMAGTQQPSPTTAPQAGAEQQPGAAMQPTGITPQPGIQQQPGVQQAGAEQQPGAAMQQPQGDVSPEIVRNLQKDMQDVLLRRQTTAQITNQRTYATLLNGLFEKGDELMPTVSKYAGVAGKAKLASDAAKSAAGENVPDYTKYLEFTQGVVPLVVNEMRRSLGSHATDAEKQAMNNVSNPLYWRSNPTEAQHQWKYLGNIFRGKIDPVLAKRPSDIQKGLKTVVPTQQTTTPATPTAAQTAGAATIPTASTSNPVNVITPSGRVLEVTNPDNLKKALALGAKLRS